MYSSASRANSTIQPGRRLLCSEDVGWTSTLLEVWEQPGAVDEFTTVGTPDQVIVMTSAGRYDIESYARGSWHVAHYSPGIGGATAPLNVSQLRWRSAHSSTIETHHLYLPQEFLLEAGEEYRRAGQKFSYSPFDFLSMEDLLIYETLRALARGIELGAPDLYSNAACRMMAVHLLLLNGSIKRGDLDREIGQELTDRRLSNVMQYMKEHATLSIGLDELAREAGISRFHFVRLFKRKLGVTPHQYLVELRLRRAASLLRTTDLDISSIAVQCGYFHAGRFAVAFRKRYLESPLNYRRTNGR